VFIEQIGIELNFAHVSNFATKTEVLYNISIERFEEGHVLRDKNN
jgi:hypothetical protein